MGKTYGEYWVREREARKCFKAQIFRIGEGVSFPFSTAGPTSQNCYISLTPSLSFHPYLSLALPALLSHTISPPPHVFLTPFPSSHLFSTLLSTCQQFLEPNSRFCSSAESRPQATCLNLNRNVESLLARLRVTFSSCPVAMRQIEIKILPKRKLIGVDADL